MVLQMPPNTPERLKAATVANLREVLAASHQHPPEAAMDRADVGAVLAAVRGRVPCIVAGSSRFLTSKDLVGPFSFLASIFCVSKCSDLYHARRAANMVLKYAGIGYVVCKPHSITRP